MFRPVKMKKLKLIAPLQYKKDVCFSMHKFGAAHINDISSRITDAEWSNLITSRVSFEREQAFIDYSKRLGEISNIVSSGNSESGSGSTLSFLPKRISRIKVRKCTEDEIEERAIKLLGEIEERVLHAWESLERCERDEKELIVRKASLELVSDIDIRADEIMSSQNFSSRLFRADTKKFEEIRQNIIETAEKRIVIEIATLNNKESLVFLTYPNDLENKVSGIIAGICAVKIDIPPVPNKPVDEINSIGKKIDAIRNEAVRHKKELADFKKTHGSPVAVLKEEADIILDRYSALKKCASTESSFVLEFFVPAAMEKEAVSVLKETSCGKAIIFSVEPMVEEAADKVPVLLSNPSFLKPFESFTNLYSVPKYNDFDPTPFIAPGILLFFGIMLNDAGYGLLLALIGFLVFAAYRKESISAKNIGIMFILLGIAGAFFGVISGGYFGDALRTVFPSIGYVLDPLGESKITLFGGSVDNPIIIILIFSIAVGVVYIDIGHLLGIADCISKMRSTGENGKGANIDELESQIVAHIGIFIFQAGFIGLLFYWRAGWFLDVPYFTYIAALFMLSGMAMLAKSNGVQTLFGFFDVTGFVGDALSFIRLLALCLATEGIANIVNKFAGFSLGVPYIGILLGTIIFLSGHAFNIVMGVLGSGIHAIRLQYVEFFSKFYEGGGTEFEPFSVKRKVTVVE